MQTGHKAPEIIPAALLLRAYGSGFFPMAESRADRSVHWVEPVLRGIIPLDGFHVSRHVERAIRNKPHEVRFNHDFRRVMELCAMRDETWINDLILRSYLNLHALGFAHSVEVYREDNLVGGLYGVSEGAAFFGESMFHLEPNMDKIALWYCHKRLLERGFKLWDTQFYTQHLGTLGAVEIQQADYLLLLQDALHHEATFA
jgi:leucyl/phenylalanyl-tRNA---protein transferase